MAYRNRWFTYEKWWIIQKNIAYLGIVDLFLLASWRYQGFRSFVNWDIFWPVKKSATIGDELHRVSWWVVWNIFFSIDWECHHPNWRTHIFQRDWNHQPKEYPYLPKCGFIRFSAANMGDFARNVDFEAWALPPASPSKCLCCRLAPWGGWNQQWMVIREGLDDFMVDSFKIAFANSFGWWITILILISYINNTICIICPTSQSLDRWWPTYHKTDLSGPTDQVALGLLGVIDSQKLFAVRS
jgi:hypothetical protein